jgi:signal transduction histidine kinase
VADQDRFRPLGHLGLRARIAATFALGATVVSLVLVVLIVVLIRRNLLNEREKLLVERAQVNVGLVVDKVGRREVDPQTVFGSLATVGRPSVLIRDPQGSGKYVPISVDTRYGASSVPQKLADYVLRHGHTAVMRYSRNGEVLEAVGVPIPGTDGVYFEVSTLTDIEKSLSSLRLPMVLAVAIAALTGAGLGWTSSRRVLRPLRDISEVSKDISLGRMDARLAYAEWTDDPDLAPLVGSFNDMVAALQDRIDRDARFASDVSHELRSPITTFNASLEVLRNAREEMPERAQLALDLLSSDMTRFTQLVEDLLEISRFDAGAVRLEMDPVALAETIRIAVRAASTTPIPVVAEESFEDRLIYCDKRRVVRIVTNFVDNAAKYAGGATRILIKRANATDSEGADEEAVAAVAAAAAAAGATTASPDPTSDEGELDKVRIVVEDEGPGVAEEDRERIFDRFNRGGQGGSRGTDMGVGLGLALAAEHARLQGGRVWAERRTDGVSGSRFILELPLLEPAEAAHDEEAMPALHEMVTATGQHPAISVDDDLGAELDQ